MSIKTNYSKSTPSEGNLQEVTDESHTLAPSDQKFAIGAPIFIRRRKTTDVAKTVAQKKIEQDNEEGKTYKTTAKAFVRRPKKTVEIKVR